MYDYFLDLTNFEWKKLKLSNTDRKMHGELLQG